MTETGSPTAKNAPLTEQNDGVVLTYLPEGMCQNLSAVGSNWTV